MTGSRNRRPAGTGSLFTRGASWYGQWRVRGRLVKRRLGPRRKAGEAGGLTRSLAERRLRELMLEMKPITSSRIGLADAVRSYIVHLEVVRDRKPSTIQDYRSMLNRHIGPYFGDQQLCRIGSEQVLAYMQAKLTSGLARKTVRNQVTLLHGVFEHAVKREWVERNPVALVDRPSGEQAAHDIRFMKHEELASLMRVVPRDDLGEMERVLYLTAAMTGLRQGELIALRWKDVDWVAGVVRVRQSITRGRLGTPKSRHSVRAVPMADQVGQALDRHHQGCNWRSDEDLVFAHPVSGRPYDPSKMRRRFKDALGRAKLRDFRFHDLRHTFGTHMAMAGAPLRALQEWMGHRDYKTTAIYADYAPDPSQGRTWANRAFGVDRGSDGNPAAEPGSSTLDEIRTPMSELLYAET